MGKGAKKEPEDSEQPQPSEPRTAPGGDAAGDGEDSDVVGLDSGNSRFPKRTLLIGVGAAWVLFAVLCVVLLASSSDDETGEDAPDAVVIDFSTDAATTLSGSAADVRNETCFAAGPGLSLLYTTFWNSSRPDAGCIGAVQSCAGATGACAAGSLGACSDSDCAVRTQGRLNVEVTGMHSGPGRVRLGVASSSGQWNRGQPQWRSPSLVKTDVAPQRGTVDISIDDIPFGVYAFVVLHDSDSDREMATTFYGAPAEGMAASNDAAGGISGGPTFAAARFLHTSAQTNMTIAMWYP